MGSRWAITQNHPEIYFKLFVASKSVLSVYDYRRTRDYSSGRVSIFSPQIFDQLSGSAGSWRLLE